MPDIVNASDAGIAVLQNNPTFRTVYPNKVFDQASAGVFAEPEDGKAIAGAILQLASDPARCAALGRNGREWVVANASRDALAARYLEVMQALTLHEAKPLEHASRAGS